MKTIFEKIIDGELPSDKVYEDEQLIVIKDKYPRAPVHLLIIPRKSIPDMQSVKEEDLPLITAIFKIAQKLARDFNLEEDGYRFLINYGPDAGQTIYHLHFHLLGGRPLGPMG